MARYSVPKRVSTGRRSVAKGVKYRGGSWSRNIKLTRLAGQRKRPGSPRKPSRSLMRSISRSFRRMSRGRSY